MSPWQPQQSLPGGHDLPGPSPPPRAPARPAPRRPRRALRAPSAAGPAGGGRGVRSWGPAPRPAPPRSPPGPPPPYQGFGYVAPLGDVFAVLLVSHPDPLFGHHGLGSWKNSELPPARTPRVSPRPGRARPLGPGRCRWRGAPPGPAPPAPHPPPGRLRGEARARTEVIFHLRKPAPTSSPSFRSPQLPAQRAPGCAAAGPPAPEPGRWRRTEPLGRGALRRRGPTAQ